MTINRLHKQLTALIAAGYGRKLVCIDKSKVTHPLESDGCRIIPVTSAELDTHEMMDDDGGTATLANGQTVNRTALVLTAEC
jgi:hypothetical protein